MKKLITAGLAALLLTSPLGMTIEAAQGSREPSFIVNNIPYQFPYKAMIVNGSTLVPYKTITETLFHKKVGWDNKTKTITASDEKTKVTLQIDNKIANVNGKKIVLNAPPVIINSITYVPLKLLSDAFGGNVAWDGANFQIKLTTPVIKISMALTGFYAQGGSTNYGGPARYNWNSVFGVDNPGRAVGNTDVINELALAWYSIDENGKLVSDSSNGWIRPNGWEDLITAADEYKMKTEMTVFLDGDMVSRVLSSPQLSSQIIASIAAEAEHYDGINIDFESLRDRGSNKQLFTSFIKQLRAKLNASPTGRKGLTVTVHPLNSSYNGYDYKALGSTADKLIIMAYEYSKTSKNDPEPVNQVVGAVKEAIKYVSPNKILLAINAEFENDITLKDKIEIAKLYQLEGIAFWPLKSMNSKMWAVVKQRISKKLK